MDRYRAIDGRVRVNPNTGMPALVASRHATTLPNVLRAASLARMHVCVSAERVIATGLSEPGFTPVPPRRSVVPAFVPPSVIML
jgi:hypothetical protein